MLPTALVVEDDADSRDILIELVRHEGFRVEGAATLAEARLAIEREPADLLLLDMRLPDGKGSDLLASDGGVGGDVIVVTGHASAESALAALQSGAVDYLVKPIDIQRLRTVLRHVHRQIELRREVGTLRGTLRSLGHFGEMVGISASMQACLQPDRQGRSYRCGAFSSLARLEPARSLLPARSTLLAGVAAGPSWPSTAGRFRRT